MQLESGLISLSDFDEDDNGFVFSRTRSKKTKAEVFKPPNPLTNNKLEEQVDYTSAKTSRKKSGDSTSTKNLTEESHATEKRRRSPRNSAEQPHADLPSIPVKKKRTKKAGVDKPAAEKHARTDKKSQEQAKKSKPADHVEISFDPTKIALPFADTPIIRRNKEMRKGMGNGHRRSSLGNRGRRASSLIDSGKSNGSQGKKHFRNRNGWLMYLF